MPNDSQPSERRAWSRLATRSIAAYTTTDVTADVEREVP